MSTNLAVAAALAHRPANDARPQSDVGIRNTLLDRVGNAYSRQSELRLPSLDADPLSLAQLRALPVDGTALEIAKGTVWEFGTRTDGTIGDLMDVFGIGRQQLADLVAPDTRGNLTAGMVANRFYDLMVR